MKLINYRMNIGCWLSLGILFTVLSPPVLAGIVNVDIQPLAFSPADVTIQANDQVQWTWVSNFHSTTSVSNLWDSGVHNTGFVFTNTFPTAGYFPYHCIVHGFTGSVTVEAPGVVTNVDILPSAFSPADITINVNDTVQWTWVSDFHSTTSDANLWDSGVFNTGYVFTNTFLTAGTFPYYCIVHGFTGTVTVQAAGGSPPLLTASQFISPSTFQFNYTAGLGLNYVVQRSPDLVVWLPLTTNQAASSSILFQDTNATTAAGFYRVLQLSNP